MDALAVSRGTTLRNEHSHGQHFAFLVSTTGWARTIRANLGSAAYSYYFVLEALAPVLEQLGTWRLVERPESRLPFLAARAAADGLRPIHLALVPPQEAYFCPALPTILYPFWEFPDIPDRDFGTDTRQNWARVCRPATSIWTACRFTASAFRRAGVECPISVVPVPLRPDHFELPDWDPAHEATLSCRHVIWGSLPRALPALAASQSVERLEKRPGRFGSLARAAFRRAAPWLGPKAVARIVRAKRTIAALVQAPRRASSRKKSLYLGLRSAYRQHVRRWLSDDARAQVGRTRDALLRLAGRSTAIVVDPLLPMGELTLSGLVYTTMFNLGDPRKNYHDLLTAFLSTFKDRADVTLVIKLVTNPVREHHELGLLRQSYESVGLAHRCRIVVITDYLGDEQMTALLRATTFYINTSHSEGACLPLQQAMAGGRPAVAAAHSALADYLDDSVAFVVDSHPEPAAWPHDPERLLETSWHRLVWTSLRDQLLASAEVAGQDLPRYQAMAAAGRSRMRSYADRDVASRALQHALAMLPDWDTGAFDWPAA